MTISTLSTLTGAATFGVYYGVLGQYEIRQAATPHSQRESPITATAGPEYDSKSETLGRYLAWGLEAWLALSGGSIIGALLADGMDAESTAVTFLSWVVLVIGVASYVAIPILFGGKMPHTTRFTRACVGLVERCRGRRRAKQGQVSLETGSDYEAADQERTGSGL